jgi:CHAT domain-containing protein
VVRRGSIAHHALAPRSRIERAVREAHTSLLDLGAEPRLDELSKLLLAPLDASLAGADALLVVPSGILFYLPLEALPLPGTSELVVDRHVTSYWPSAGAFAELRARPTRAAAARLLAVGDPAYGDDAGALRGATLAAVHGLGRLPHTRGEVAALGRLFPGAATLLVGEEARESSLKALDTGAYSLVHLGAHGLLDPLSPSRSGLVLSPEIGTVHPGAEDGILQPREVLRLRLAAELVTLSACQSALGELVTGEGIVGLARSFFYAGTDTVVASLWNVNDRASARLMTRFYRHLAGGAPKAEALRRARLDLRRDDATRHPYYWAPFVLLGDGAGPVAFPPRAGRWWLAPLAAGLLGAAVLAARALRRRPAEG